MVSTTEETWIYTLYMYLLWYFYAQSQEVMQREMYKNITYIC